MGVINVDRRAVRVPRYQFDPAAYPFKFHQSVNGCLFRNAGRHS